ncbi:Autolysis histidine kinase LytS [Dehalobacter sp. UNSWDHB]|jgi:Putative regulator of cell autolysis|uniref:sensor histidine kinase n=1 Tax=unclassified Dehalobacter TaxID=2635733 RepID=UPI00028A7F54|nr:MULTISPECIES: histidine kinase [unclassified Dehalobacter]AFV02678.1 Autolysis histidine kinase LytS [Dehalobacter sp. DCA]AFV05663.1 Autolysis histidine kinase LytS [Dehalobacter sp. CF]EQB21233.1 Autolysis histidine kinase LytS [Dehalobacter sp. UNSWDHB]OCZ54700.1 histidine kinase [Dehalobacter sp. TeCB1]
MKNMNVILVPVIALEIALGLYLQNTFLLAAFMVIDAGYFFWYMKNLEKKAVPLHTLSRADLSVKIANETLPYLRGGLNKQNAEAIAKIIQGIAQVAAVSITDCEKQLAYLGAGCDRHHPGDKILTAATREVIQTAKYKVVQTQEELNCPMSDTCDCPLAAAVIVPLSCKGNVVGTFKLYETKGGKISPDLIRLALGMGQILSLQVEVAELDHQTNLTMEARLDALQAQINPHFFFNVLNTIIATSRTNPNRARRLLIHLAEFFRKSLKSKGALISLREEMEFVNNYFVLEKARFGKKLKIKLEIPKELMDAEVPRLSIQPLVENAVKHGITPMIMLNGVVTIRVRELGLEDGKSELFVEVIDNGMGIEEDRLKDVLLPGVGSGNGVGLANVHARLKGLYGSEYGLNIESKIGEGTTVEMRLPYKQTSPQQPSAEPWIQDPMSSTRARNGN